MSEKTNGQKATSRQRGFTLIELILYMAIVTIMLGALIPFAWNQVGIALKSTTEQEVFSQARFLANRMQTEIRNASGISAVTATSLTLTTTDVNTNPTVIDLSSGTLRIKYAGSAAVSLNSSDVTVSSVNFTNNSSADSKTQNISFQLTLASNFGSVRQEYTESTTIRSSAEIRSN